MWVVIVGVALLGNVGSLDGKKPTGEQGGADLESVTMDSELSVCLSKMGGGGGQECASLGLYPFQMTITTLSTPAT